MPSQSIEETSSCDLGDERLSRRFASILAARRAAPQAAGPQCFDTSSARKAYYRFMENPRLEHEQLLSAHYERTRGRAEARGCVLVVHDTTRLHFNCRDGFIREHLGQPSSKKQGFDWHASLALDAEEPFACLGLIASQPFSRLADHRNTPQSVGFWRERGGIFENEQERWMRGVEQAEARLEGCAQVIHLMDREGDDYEGMFCMLASDYDFVVRASHDRLVQIGPRRADTSRLSEVLAAQPVLTTKTIEVSARTADKARRSYPVRAARQAEVSIRSATVDLRRPAGVPTGSAADVLTVHVVEVVELEPPAGDEAVRWVLLTRVPTPDAESCLRVVRWYQARWVIEEYFKALKTGCAFLQSQLQSASALLRQLATDAQVACDVLHLRDEVRVADERPAHHTLTQLQLLVLSQIYSRITPDSSLHDAWMAIAELGGHFKHKGPPGWLVLCRGWRKLNDRVRALEDAANLLAQHPQLAALINSSNLPD